MEQMVHLCVTRELFHPADLWVVRWLTEHDLGYICAWFQGIGDPAGMTLEEWRQLHDEGYLYCGILLDGKLCSIAGVWKRAIDIWEVISVRTEERYRRREMAKCAVSFVTDYILQQVSFASYTSRESNIASIRTAQSVGFRYCTNIIGKEKWCVKEPRPPVKEVSCPLINCKNLQTCLSQCFSKEMG